MFRRYSTLSLSIGLFLCVGGSIVLAPKAQAQTTEAKSSTNNWQLPLGALALVGGGAGVFYLGRRTGKQSADRAVQVQQTFQDYDKIFQDSGTDPQRAAVGQRLEATLEMPAAMRQVPVAAPVTAAVTVPAQQATAPDPALATAPAQTTAPTLEMVSPKGEAIAPDLPPANANSTTSAIEPSAPAPLLETQRLVKGNVVESLIQELHNPDPTQRRRAIWELTQRGDTRAVQPLVDLMMDSDSKQRSLILSALSEIGTRTLKPMSRALAISLQDESADVRKNAIRDLTRVYDLMSQISQMVQKATEDPDRDVRETAQWALNQMNRFRVPEGNANLKTSVSPPESLP